jgi:methyl-accepting chemotaxis protein
MKLQTLRIGTKLSLSFGIILAILTFVAIFGNVLNSKTREKLVAGLDTANQKTQLAVEMKTARLHAGVALRNLGLQSQMGEQEQIMQQQEELYDVAKASLLGMGLSDQEKTILDTIDGLDKELKEPLQRVQEHALKFQLEAAAKLIMDTIEPIDRKLIAKTEELVDLQKSAYQELLKASIASDRQVMVILYGVSALGLAIGALLAWRITRSLLKQLGGEPAYASSVAMQISSGDLSSHIAVKPDAQSSMMHSMKVMQDSLAEIVSQVRSGTETIATASSEVAAGSQDLSSRTAQAAASIEETAASMEELMSTVQQNADNARQANSLAGAASSVANKGGVVIGQVVGTMGEITDSARKIVDIISVIDGIAFQTNILALNAAVEAARAGEQGRGFAVVSSEVRNLAQRSAAAAKEIKTLIDHSVERVETGSKLVNQAGATMQDIVESVRRVTDIMGEITAATQEQTSGIAQINLAITQMDEITQQNAALVEQAAAASEAVQRQANKLAQVMSVFKLAKSQLTAVAANVPVGIESKVNAPAIERNAALNLPPPGRKQLAKSNTTAGAEWTEF